MITTSFNELSATKLYRPLCAGERVFGACAAGLRQRHHNDGTHNEADQEAQDKSEAHVLTSVREWSDVGLP
jgi:hypothetical protein